MKYLLRVVACCLATPAFAQSPCDGKITDWNNHPKGAAGQIAQPNAGESYVDPVFGTKITRISQPNPAEGSSAVIETLYNGMRGWNADSSQIVAWHRGGGSRYEFYMGDEPYTLLGSVNFNVTTPSDNTIPADIEHLVWDSEDPTVLYYPAYDSKGGRLHPVLMKVQLNTWPTAPTVTVQRDFNTECAAHGVDTLNVISFGHSMDMSYDGDRKVGLRCGVSGGTMWNFLYSITDNTIIGDGYISIPAFGYTTYDYPPWPCPSGNCSWRQGFGWMYDSTFTHTKDTAMENSLEHSTVGYSLSGGGFDYVAQSAFDETNSGNLVIWKLNQSSPIQPHVIIGQGVGGLPYPTASTGSHPTLSAKDGSGWMAVGNVGPNGTGNDGVLSNELIMANVNTDVTCRVAHTRTRSGTGGGLWAYWGETHPQISHDGYRILFNSDWENSNTVSLFVADLRPQTTTILTPSLPNAVKGENYSLPLSITGSTPPYTCTKTVGNFPTGVVLAGTGNCTVSATAPNPTTVESQTFTLQACDSSGTPVCNTHQYTLVVQERPTITTSSPLPAATVGTPTGITFAATGGVGPLTWEAAGGTACEGTVLSSAGGLDNAPIKLETCTFTVRVTDSHAQPISNTKQFSLTIALPSACLPGGSSVCMRAFPSDTKVFVRYGQVGLPSNSTCTAVIKLNGSTVDTIQTTSGFARRPTLFTGLTPSTLYTLSVSCTGLGDVSGSVVTTAFSGGTRDVVMDFKPNALMPTATQLTLDYGPDVVTDFTTTNSSCGSGCRITLTLDQDVYRLRHTWKTAGGAALAQSDIRYLAVN